MVIWLAAFAPSTSLARAMQTTPVAPDPEFALIRTVLADVQLGRDGDAQKRIAADPALARAAFDELIADRVNVRLYEQPALAPNELHALGIFAAVLGPETQALAEKAERVAKRENPFDPTAPGIERALAAYCSIEQVERPDEPSSAIEQRRRAEIALDASRSAGGLIATVNCLHWLALYAFQGGDIFAARRYWTEAADGARRSGQAALGFSIHRYISLTYALEGSIPNALREAIAAEQYIASGALDVREVRDAAASLYANIIDYSTGINDRATALLYTRRFITFLETIDAPPTQRAEAFERLGAVYAQTAARSGDDALKAREALLSAADLFVAANEPERALTNFTAAGVVMIENADPGLARPPLERGRSYATGIKDDRALVGLDYWLGRSYLAEASKDPKNAQAHWDRGVATLKGALDRLAGLEGTGTYPAELKITVTFWLGRAMLEGPTSDRRAALGYFRQTFDAAVTGKRVNEAVTSVELIVRCYAGLGDLAAANRVASECYDRLAASGNIDPLVAANAISVELKRVNGQGSGRAIPPGLVAFYEHVLKSLEGDTEGRQAGALGALVVLAAETGDRQVLKARALDALHNLLTAERIDDAERVADAVTAAWADLGEQTLAAEWAGRFADLAGKSYEKAVADGRDDDAQQAAEGRARAEQIRGDAVEAAVWRERARVAEGKVIERFSRSGKFGLAVQAARTLGLEYANAGRMAEARQWLQRAVGFEGNINDVEARAQTLAALARVDVLDGKPESALARTRDLFALTSRTTAAGSGSFALPDAGDVLYPTPTVSGLLVCGAAYEALAADAPENAEYGERAVAAYRLALLLCDRAGEDDRALLPESAEISGRLVRALARSGQPREALTELSRVEAEATGGEVPQDLDKLQKSLPPRTVLLAFLRTDAQVFAVVVANGQVSVRDIKLAVDDAEVLAKRLARLAPTTAKGASDPGFDLFARQAREALVSPLAGNLKGANKVLLLDTGTLANLPVQALSGDFQIERVRLTPQMATRD